MAKGSGEATTPLQKFSDEDVMEASFRLEAVNESGKTACNLYLRTYVLEDAENRIWHLKPEKEWPLLASITPNQISGLSRDWWTGS
ncbi:hypothetical protein N5C55_06520 [Pseudomonas otitidis]|uniref:hypothetical protein n=1 Tax=Metapseudomonas otitidis TaxID=319939 RepID=UPI00244B80F5|nr:hypothetical protein [Pseudomonas otitidis]MDH1107367.1 hypothetical protein [Pseudomonas otitidis]MDH1157816.1 hypothetical protein [Pseudomonas otitidis]MDH1164345.1 hypothetical protein [Pseudomonas otitidis]